MLFQDAFFISPAITLCHLPFKQKIVLVWLYPYNYQWLIYMMPLKIKNRLLC